MSSRSVARILKENKYKPYKIHLLHELNEDDADRRLQFCETMMEMSNNGFVNRHNCRYWSVENPHWMLEHHTQHPQKINVWVGIIGQQIIGPYFLENTLTGDGYLNLLRNHIVPAILNLFPNGNHVGMPNRDLWFQQDGAPPHYALNVRRYLDTMFAGRWIGRRGAIEWPARSPDLNPLDFFLWGHLKTQVYKEKPRNLEDLRIKIRHEIQLISPNGLQNTIRHFWERLGYCQAAEGRQFEHLI